MRFLLISALFASSMAAQEQKCRVEGQVLSISGAPLKKATLRLQAASQMSQSNFLNYSVSTDNEGKFFFEGITPGAYILSCERTGYLRQYYGTKNPSAGAMQMKLDAGQEMKDLVFKLIPQGMIFGKLVDDDGDPLPGFPVRASRWMFVNGKRQLQVVANSSSQADGTFILGNLAAARYYLSAESRDAMLAGGELSGNNTPQESYLKTYFPSALDAASAALVDVAPGAELRGVEIHVRRGRAFDIRGRVEGAPNNTALLLTPKSTLGNPRLEQKVAFITGQSKAFGFKNVTPGTYIIETQNAPAGSTKLVARLELTVSDQNLENVVVPLTPALEIKGGVKTEGDDKTATPARPGVNLRDLADSSYGGGAETESDGKFSIQGVFPSTFRVNVYNLPDNVYVKSMTFAGQDVNGKDLDLTSGAGGEMQILLSPNGAEVTGIVRDADGKPVPAAVVQFIAKDGEIAKTTTTDQNGAFDEKGLAPGDYQVFAWEDREDGIISDPDFRKSFESKSTAVKLAEKSRENIEPVLITKGAMEVEAAKIR